MALAGKPTTSRRGLLKGTAAAAVALATEPGRALSAAFAQQPQPITLERQGSFAVGGTVIKKPGTFDPSRSSADGQTFHGDHAYVFYQVPVKTRKYPLVFWHGTQQFSKTWETTPDGREGFQTIFLRRNYSTYLIDQPRRGNAGRSTVALAIDPVPDEQRWFGVFRVGIWPDYFPGVQFSRTPRP